MNRLAPSLSLVVALSAPGMIHAASTPAAAEAKSAPAAKLGPDDNVGPLMLVDEGMPQVVALLERITGRMAIRSQEVPALKVNFTSVGDLKRRQAEAALESLLALNGVAVMPEGEDFLKIVPLAKGPQAESPPLFTDSVAGLPASERVVARLFTLRNAPVTAIEPLLQGLVNKGRGGSLMVLPAGNAILVTDSLNSLQRAEALVARMDQPGEVLFLPLRNSRATEMVKQLKALQGSGPKTAFAGEAGFEADETTNQVIVVTTGANVARVREIVERLDSPTNERTRTEVIGLRYIEAERVVKIIESLTKGASGGTTSTGDAAALNRGRRQSNQSAGTNTRTSGPGTAQSFSAGNRQPGAEGEEGFSRQFTVVAETRTNSLVLYGTDADFRRVKDVITKVDVKMAQVRIEAVIVEVTLGTAEASGLETLGLGYKTSGTGTNGKTSDVKFNTSSPNTPGTGKPPLSISGSLNDFSLETVFNLARQDSKVKVLSSPVIVTSHNSAAAIKVGQKQPIVTSSASDLQNLSTSRSTVEYRDIGLQLEVTPRIGSNGVVEMDVKQTIESVVGTTVIDKNDQPIIGTREANSYLSANSDEVVVLAGLQSYRERKTKGKVWLLGDIPWLGEWLFQPETNSEEKSELIVFLRPHVLTEADKVPAADTPGFRPESLTRPEATDRVHRGGFEVMNKEMTYFEREERDKEVSRKRAETEALGDKKEEAKR